jgi:gliding motility-associated-like protein
VIINLSASDLQVPYAFSPNGDGINDEFRVAYISLKQFKCWVFNRWGRQIFVWTDPQKGWDGTINGRPAAQGAYFYIIEATGSDGKKYKQKGSINLLRGK